ncbi:Inactive dipeptidyl peptidase 10 [Bagarius yarrelli]|uniref:Inactive dipeptidyl peptidase 10 n=1 Tax=Bagarius yarrelli TaxID=175774 RepID=A0A556TW57_BAGYA|nr:Inactive dipeptidyl peptidase 10 [Bagarius yarrelli]
MKSKLLQYRHKKLRKATILVICHSDCMSLFQADTLAGSDTKLTVEDLFSPDFYVHDPEALWINDSPKKEKEITNQCKVAFKATKYSISPDMKYVLFAYDVKQVYRHSFTASYIIYNIHTREVWELDPPEVYIFENNIYYQSDVKSNSLRLTSSGKEGVVYNGIADWLYEEEILHTHVAHWWSPDGERLAFLVLNDSLVPNMALPSFTGATYPKGKQYPYPKRHEETSELWLSKQDQKPFFSQDGSRFFLTVPVKQGGRGEFHHIAMFTTQVRVDQNEVRHLTSGNWEVTEILAYDENSQTIVSTVGLFPRRCLTCDLNKAHCTYFSADFSPAQQHVILHCKDYFALENNSLLKAAVRYKRIQITEYKTLQTDRFDLPLKISFPPDFSDSRHYGLLLMIDSIPGGQQVDDRYSVDWDSVLVSSDNVIVARLDGRGSGFQGQKILQEVHKRLGVVELQDQLAALEYLMKFPYIDQNRIGVFGRGYGGYVTLLLVKSTESLFKCAVAMSPVTDWTLHASAFSERYLGVPLQDDSRYQIYPDEGHFLTEQSRQHLSASLSSYFRSCLQEDIFPLSDEEEEEEE